MAALAGMAFLAHGDYPQPRAVRGQHSQGRAVPAGQRPQLRADHQPGRGGEQVDAQPRLRAAVPGQRLRHGDRRQGPRPDQEGRHRRDRPDGPRPERGRGVDLHPRRRRRGVGHRHADAGAAGGPERRLQRAQGDGRQRRPLPGEVPDERGRHRVQPRQRRRGPAADQRRRRRHAVQRRRVRLQAGRRLPGVRRPVLRPVQGAVEQGDGATSSTCTCTPPRRSTRPATSTGTATFRPPATN